MGNKLQQRTTAGLGAVAGAGAALLFSLGNAPLAGAAPGDTTLTDLLGAGTNQFTAFSNNITDNLQASVAGDNAIFGDYLTGLGNPAVNNTAALNGLSEVSTQLNTQLANTNGEDLAGFNDVLGADHNVATIDNFTPTADAIQAAFAGSGDFTFGDGVTASEVATALANSDLNFGSGDITAVDVVSALASSDLSAQEQADLGINFEFLSGLPYFDPNDVAAGITFSPYDVADVLNSTNPAIDETALGDVLGAQTDQFSAFSNNLTDNLLAAGNGDAGIYTNYIGALANGVNNGAALGGLDEVSGQLNDQLSNANAFDLSGFDSVLDSNFTNLGDFLGI